MCTKYHKIADMLQIIICGKISNISYIHQVLHLFSIFNLHVSFRHYDSDSSVLHFDNDNRKHKKKKKKKKHTRKETGFLESSDLHSQKQAWEKEESHSPGDCLREQYGNDGSRQPDKEGMPSCGSKSKN